MEIQHGFCVNFIKMLYPAYELTLDFPPSCDLMLGQQNILFDKG